MNDVLKRITSLMNHKNWTLYKLAKESDIPYSSLNSMFQKNNQPTISTLEKICKAFNITLSEFFSNTPLDSQNSSFFIIRHPVFYKKGDMKARMLAMSHIRYSILQLIGANTLPKSNFIIQLFLLFVNYFTTKFFRLYHFLPNLILK